MYRKRLNYNYSKSLYKRTARRTNVANLSASFVPRGGFRM